LLPYGCGINRGRFSWLTAGVAAFFVFILIAVQPAPARGSTPEVLILNSYHSGYSWTDEQTDGIGRALRAGGFQGDPIVEYMDWKRAPSEANLDELYRLYRLKYAKRQLAIVFVTDNAALQFALRHRDEIFRGAKIVFCGINGYTDGMLAGQKDVTGVVEEVDPTGTVDVALKLHPLAKEVLIVFDGTESGREARNDVARQVAKYGKRVKFRFLDDPLVSEIETQIHRMSPGDLVLQGAYTRDRTGKTYNIDEVVRMIAPNSPVPIYGLWEDMCGKGIVGGSLLSGRLQGETAGRMGLRILSGEPVANIPVLRKTPMILMFDYQQILRFGIDPELLPKGSVVVNRPLSFYDAYKHIFWFFAVIIALLSVTIGVLVLNMAARRMAEKALLVEKEYIEQIISIAPTMICSIAEDGRILSLNDAVRNVSGYCIEALGDKNWWEVFSDKSPVEIAELMQELRQGPVFDHEMTLLTVTGEKRVISWNLVARSFENLVAREIIGIGADVTERKLAEEEREQFLRELESMNKELESIVYVASHDLRSPLVNIQGFSRKLGKACQELNSLFESSEVPAQNRPALDSINQTIAKSLRFITSSVEKMDTLLGGLLRLSRLGRKALKHETIDMDRLVEDVVSSMTYQVQKAGGAVEVEPLLPCAGDPVQINQVFSNLIDNAIKYGARERALRIGISSHREGNEVVFCVKDNGIGIPAAQQQKIWEIFHRLNPGSEVEGEGLGLTVVRRILDRSNGKVWVESASGTGSSFFVALPGADPDKGSDRFFSGKGEGA
jgi:PAS domain S-box-containing protein